MLRLPAFDYIAAQSIEEAASILAGEGAAEAAAQGRENPVRLVAGGTDLWPNMKRRHQSAKTVVSLMDIPGLADIPLVGNTISGHTPLVYLTFVLVLITWVALYRMPSGVLAFVSSEKASFSDPTRRWTVRT